jgi:hypothetical protein
MAYAYVVVGIGRVDEVNGDRGNDCPNPDPVFGCPRGADGGEAPVSDGESETRFRDWGYVIRKADPSISPSVMWAASFSDLAAADNWLGTEEGRELKNRVWAVFVVRSAMPDVLAERV